MTSEIIYSIVIPTYNRYFETRRAVVSAIEFNQVSNFQCEIIVVDDCSSDDSYDKLLVDFSHLIDSNFFRIFRLPINSGVVKARIEGAKISRGKWLIPLDSDNEILMDAFHEMNGFISTHKSAAYFFLCVNEDEKPILNGIDSTISRISAHDMLNKELPEFFGIYDKLLFLKYFEDKLLIKLRRFEVIGNLEYSIHEGDFLLAHLILRKYHMDGLDRLSSKRGVLRDAKILRMGNLYLLANYFSLMTWSTRIMILLKVVYYFINEYKLSLNK